MRLICNLIRRQVLPSLALLLPALSWAEDATVHIDFSRDIKPILSNTCYRCHGPDDTNRKGGTDGLRLDTAAGMVADLGGHAAIVPGKPDASELIQRISSADDDQVMPPKGAGKRLTPREVELFNAWIKQGAKFNLHWSYVSPVRPPRPATQTNNWGHNEIDRFLLARFEREGLKPSPEADRASLIRRVSLDLTGLPPTIDEVRTFTSDSSPNAYEQMVDRILAKPAYGEHWGLLWLDLARYADSAGYADDPSRTIWLYRDYVIKSFNANKPFDQFTIEQIAGDLLPNPTEEQLMATAFHRNTLTNNEGGTNDEEFRNVAIVDRVNTTMAVWMGTTMACAQCHTHKYDPITQEEYFRFFAFFNNTEDADRKDESPLLSIYSPDQLKQRSEWQSQIAKLEPIVKTVTPELAAAQTHWDDAFPRSIAWSPTRPIRVESQAKAATTIAADGIVKVAKEGMRDTYTVELSESIVHRVDGWLDSDRLKALGMTKIDVLAALREKKVPILEQPKVAESKPDQPDFQLPALSLELQSLEQINDLIVKKLDNGVEIPFRDLGRLALVRVPLRAIRLDALPDETLPEKGSGHGSGNFVVSKITAKVIPPAGTGLKGRFVRVELPSENYLSLAEVQVFSGIENVALGGDASQVSTDYGGDAKRAIDGNTNGDYHAANSTTHTALGKDSWWEVDLKSPQSIERIAIWNRTDGAGERLANFRVLILDEARKTVWKGDVVAPPNPSSELRIEGPRTIEFDRAFADYTQTGFDPQNVILGKDPRKGWSVGGQTDKPHSLTLIPKGEVEIPAGSTIEVTIEQSSDLAHHTLAQFQFSASDEPRVDEWAKTPSPIGAALQVPVAERSPEQKNSVTQYFLGIAPELEATRQQLATLQKSVTDQKPETVPIMKELATNRRVTKIQHRGNFEDLGKEVTEGTPASFPPLPSDIPPTRLALARWLVDAKNPLTARVIANRYWEQLFGIGLVATSEEFGSQGDQPSHPELLDWLACELAGIPDESGVKVLNQPWDLKAFVKLLVMSAAYRQSSLVTLDQEQRDPDNRLLARGPRFRLSAEALRDQALFVSGLLSPKMFGPPVRPPQPNLGLNAAFGSSTDWQTSTGEDKYRRGVYTTWRRSNPYPSMAAFDAPNREVCTVRRVRTNTPLQALVTLNDPAYIEAAQALARRIVKEGGPTPEQRGMLGFELVLQRPPHANEASRVLKLYEQAKTRFSQNAEDAKRIATEPLGQAEAGADLVELASWTVVGNVLLNLDEVMMKR